MDYGNFGNIDYGMPKPKKNNTSTIIGIILIVLLIIVIGITIFIAYKAITEEDDVVENKEETNTNNLLSDEEALKIGEDLYAKGYNMEFNRTGEFGLEACRKRYDEAQKLFVKGAKINYTPAYYRQEADIKYSKLESNYYNESGSLDCMKSRPFPVEFYMSEEKLAIKSKKEKVITFDKVVTYCDKYTYEHLNGKSIDKCTKKVKTTYSFIIEKEQDGWKIARLSITH